MKDRAQRTYRDKCKRSPECCNRILRPLYFLSLSLLIGTGTICSDLDECDKNEHNCAPLSARCKNTVGSFTCDCLDGFTGDGLNCYNIDECKAGTHHCGEHMECVDNSGSYACLCVKGFVKHLEKCIDIDDCEAMQDRCHTHARCIDNEGSYECLCEQGWSGNGFECQNIDECADPGLNACHTNSICIDNVGSYHCKCNDGYESDDQIIDSNDDDISLKFELRIRTFFSIFKMSNGRTPRGRSSRESVPRFSSDGVWIFI